MKLPKIVDVLLFNESRKVCFGVYLFVVSNAFLWFKVIQSGDWMACIALSTALVGGGTLGDAYFKSKSQSLPPTQ